MSKWTSIFVLTVFTAFVLKDAYTLIDFHLNQQELIRKFCINKTNTIIMCNGVCYLTKEMKMNDFSNQLPTTQISFELNDIKLLPTDLLPKPVVVNSDVFLNALVNTYAQGVSRQHLKDIFHPPQMA